MSRLSVLRERLGRISALTDQIRDLLTGAELSDQDRFRVLADVAIEIAEDRPEPEALLEELIARLTPTAAWELEPDQDG